MCSSDLWWWGANVNGNGGNRANWDFDLMQGPVVNGEILANGAITGDGKAIDPLKNNNGNIGGLAGSNPEQFLHAGVPRLSMPNLKDLSYYEDRARSTGGKLMAQNVTVNAVHTDAKMPGVYLYGTDANPIVLDGSVVIPGDVVIGGKITGMEIGRAHV